MGRRKLDTYSEEMKQRVLTVVELLLGGEETIRSIADKIGVSHQTVYTDIHTRLPRIDKELYKKVQEVLEQNAKEKGIRGAISNQERSQRRKQFKVIKGRAPRAVLM